MPTYPEVIDDIEREDAGFVNTGRPRIGGSTLSSGVFEERATGRLWVGKANMVEDPILDEASACKEKVANDIYAY